jgi:hypothetical protein
MQAPVRIKLYRLITVTKRGYFTRVAIGAVGLLVLLIVWAVTVGQPTAAEKEGRLPNLPWYASLPLYVWRNWAPWIIAGGYLFGLLEALYVLQRFRRAEAGQAGAAAPDTTPKGN